MSRVFAVSGPTGSGKTDFSLLLAKDLNLPVINADPFQFYRELKIIGNQPDASDVPIEWLSFQSIQEPLTAGDFSRLSLPRLREPGLWVGTGMYLGAALYGLDADRRKGAPFQGKPRTDFKMIVLDPPRDELYQRLDRRVDSMLERGAFKEAESVAELLKRNDLSSNNPLLKAIGLKHLLLHLLEGLAIDEAVRLWKRDTRRLAKRQWTWLRKFSAPSKNCLWLGNSSLSQARDFFYST